MKVLLLKNVPKLGKRNEIKDVATGFARNYLFPRELARAVKENELEELKKQQTEQQARAKEELKRAQEVAAQIEGLEIEIPVKVSSAGEAYSAISPKKIADVLQAMGHDISADDLIIEEPIKHVGEHTVSISLNDGIETEVTVILLDKGEADIDPASKTEDGASPDS